MIELRDIPGFDGWYSAGSDGRIYSWKKHRMQGVGGRRESPFPLKPVLGRNGYEYVAPFRNNKNQRLTVHRLVLLAFHGEPPFEKAECRHLNCDRRDNRPENLAWGTRAENMSDTVRNGRTQRGEKHSQAKLNEQAVKVIRHLCKPGNGNDGVDHRLMAAIYGVNRTTIGDIVNNRTRRNG